MAECAWIHRWDFQWRSYLQLSIYFSETWILPLRIFSLKEFHTFCFGLSFVRFRCELETDIFILSSHLTPCHPASRTCKLDANYRGELNAPVGLVSHPPTLSIFNSFFSSTLYSVAHFGVLIYTNQYVKDICWHLFVFLQWYRRFFSFTRYNWLNNQTKTKTLDKARNK